MDMVISLVVSFSILFFSTETELMLNLLLIARTYGSGNELFDGTIIQSLQSDVGEEDEEEDVVVVEDDAAKTLWITIVDAIIRKISTMVHQQVHSDGR